MLSGEGRLQVPNNKKLRLLLLRATEVFIRQLMLALMAVLVLRVGIYTLGLKLDKKTENSHVPRKNCAFTGQRDR